MSPTIGTFVRALVTSSCSNPPIASVSPLLINTFESSDRVSMIELAAQDIERFVEEEILTLELAAAVDAKRRRRARDGRYGARHWIDRSRRSARGVAACEPESLRVIRAAQDSTPVNSVRLSWVGG